MNTPGISIFQGAEPLRVNTVLERQEEQELLEDQKRYEEELGNLLQNAFDDLDDGDSTIDSTNNYQSDLLPEPQNNYENQFRQHQATPLQFNGDTLDNHAACESDIHQMKMLLESRGNELCNIKKLASEKHAECEEYQKRLSMAEAELERALLEKKNTHELLVDSKEQCSNLESTILKLRNEKRILEAEYNDNIAQLETTQRLLAEAQQKYDMVERDYFKRDDRNAEKRIKQLEEHQRAQTDLMQQQINSLNDQLERKNQECEQMSARYNALQSSHERMLLDKATRINDLNLALSEAQNKLSDMLAQPDYGIECQRLQKLNSAYQEQIASMEKTITTLNERLNSTTAELDMMDTLLMQHSQEDSSGNFSQMRSRLVGSTPLSPVDRIGQIKEELRRALGNLKNKRDELRKMQQTLDERNAEIRTLRADENKALVQLTTLREDNIRLESRIKVLESEMAGLDAKNRTQTSSEIQKLQHDLNEMRKQRTTLENECDRLAKAGEEQENERKKIVAQLKNVEIDLEEVKQEHENMRRNYEQIMEENKNLRSRTTADTVRLELERHKLLLKDSQSECERLKNLYTEITNDKEAIHYELEQLRNADTYKELQELRSQVAHLKHTLQLTEMKSTELAKILETEKTCHEREMQTLRDKFEKQKLEQMKAMKESSNNCTKCIDFMAQITKLEVQSLKMDNLHAIQKKELDDLNCKLKDSKEQIAELNTKLKLSEHQERLIAELKVKAAEFEQYIKVRSSSSERSQKSLSPTALKEHVSSSEDKSPSVQNDLPVDQVKQIEARMRREMAKIFADELKRFQLKIQQSEEQSLCLQREYQTVCTELQQRQTEVELLKQAILAEREKIEEILNAKDAECKENMQKQKVILHKCRDELKLKSQRINELTKELQERQSQIEAERKSMKAVMEQWEEQRKSIDTIEMEWEEKMKQLTGAHETTMESMTKRMNSLKRMVKNYQLYAEDKEAHFMREIQRIKRDYDVSLVQMEARINKTLERKTKEQASTLRSAGKIDQVLSPNKENKPLN